MEMKFYFGCREQFARGANEQRRGGSPREESFGRVFLPTRAERYTDSVTASARQAPLHLHTECVPLYLFIHFHVAKCCHFDE